MTTFRFSLLQVVVVVLLAAVRDTRAAFAFSPFSTAVAGAAVPAAVETKEIQKEAPVLTKVAVSGATGRTGKLVVEELLERNVRVVAMVRSMEKAKETFSMDNEKLQVMECDLTSKGAIENALKGCDAAVWCATGFSDAPSSNIWTKVQSFLQIAVAPKIGIDAVGIPAFGSVYSGQKEDKDGMVLPRVVMLSSAGVTRPQWDDAKKEQFAGSADIPIVRLNPFGILDIKAESEEKLRNSGANYCIVRPTGLNDDWPAGSRPVFSQGDVAVGRINRKDVAKVLVDVLTCPEAVGKTFEMFGLAGYPPPTDLNQALARLKPDAEGLPSTEELAASYSAMQQLLPGERQDSAGLAMGQTYEQLDKDEVGRLGKRGEEDAEAAAPKPTTTL